MSRNYPVPSAGPFAYTDSTQKDGIIFASAARTAAAYNSPEYLNPGAKGLRLFIDITANTGNTGTVTVKIQNYDPASASWIDVPEATTAALATVASTVFTIHPEQEEDANTAIAQALGVRWRVVATVGTAACTFSIGADYLS